MKQRFQQAAFAAFWCLCATAASGQSQDHTIFYNENGLTLRWHFQGGIYIAAEDNVFWNLPAVTAPGSGYNPDKRWQEAYIKPGVSLDYALDTGVTLYGRLSAVSSYTFGTDPFEASNTGATTLEEAFIGLRGPAFGGLSYDLSFGPRELKLGTGMLISNGASSGFERGTLKFGPRKAWEEAFIARLSNETVTGTAFYLDPNELPSSDGGNELVGFDLLLDSAQGGYLGLIYVDVLASNTPYPQAAPGGVGAPTITPGARNGTQTVSLYARTNRFDGMLENWVFTADYAAQWNDDIDLNAWAGRVQASYSFADTAWNPTVTVGYQSFSGDDPNTTALERFDPLYYEGSPNAWATGTKSASTFINSNVNALSLALRMQPSPRDTVTLRYAHVRANELRSPIQFGQATRVDTTGGAGSVVSGVTDPHLSDDVFLEWNRVLNRNTFLSAGLAVSFPGAGIEAVAGGSSPTWTGAFLNVVVNF